MTQRPSGRTVRIIEPRNCGNPEKNIINTGHRESIYFFVVVGKKKKKSTPATSEASRSIAVAHRLASLCVELLL